MLSLEVGGKGHAHEQLRASPFPKLKQWSEWEKEFALSMVDRFGRGGKSLTSPAWKRWQQRQRLSKQGQQCERGKLALMMLQHFRNSWTQQRSLIPGGVEAGAPGVAGEGDLALGRKQLIKEHKAVLPQWRATAKQNKRRGA